MCEYGRCPSQRLRFAWLLGIVTWRNACVNGANLRECLGNCRGQYASACVCERVKCKSQRLWLSLGTGKSVCVCVFACSCAWQVPELMQHVRDELVNTLCLASAVVRMQACVCGCACVCVCVCRIRFSHGSLELGPIEARGNDEVLCRRPISVLQDLKP